ncbi:pilus assembly protein PilP [Ramlibacter sp.]|uniref:pilus assembly protein PilP n=1 Tax=Ramlibacter sp. TaxID=1917967 RepID=UPI003D0DFF8E
MTLGLASLLRAALAASLLVSALAGCGSESHDELQQWMNDQRSQTRPKVQPIPEPKKYTPQAYTQEAAVDPFSTQKLAQALKKDTTQSSTSAALIAPEQNRRKQPLESFPLDSMSMVGSLVRQGQPVALLQVDKHLYQVRPGEYIGQNFGRITKVGETEVELRELVQDATGEWIERKATLQLQERSR